MKGLNIPERFVGTIYIHIRSNPMCSSYGNLAFFDSDLSQYVDDLTLIGTADVDIPLDSKGTVDKQVEKLRQSKQQIIEDATRKAEEIDEAIESLLAIEHTTGDQDDD